MRTTQQFHRGLLPMTTQQKENKFRETHWNIFGLFGFSWTKQFEEEKQKREKIFTRESSQQVKEEARNLFGFSFDATIKLS